MNVHRIRPALSIVVLGACLALIAIASHSSRSAAAPVRSPLQHDPISQPTLQPVQAPIGNSQVGQLDDQLKTLRAQFHAQLDPLQAQVKAVRDQYDPQIKSLEDQRHTAIEQGKSPAVQQLDTQESSDLDQLATQEKAAVDKVHQDFSDQRKQLQAKYQAQIKDLLATRK